MHAKGRGIIGMKLVGNGDFTTPTTARRALQFVLTCGCVDAVVMGFKSLSGIDEAVGRMNRISRRRETGQSLRAGAGTWRPVPPQPWTRLSRRTRSGSGAWSNLHAEQHSDDGES